VSIVTISAQMGSGGADIAHALADRLGYQLIGSEQLAKVAIRHGLVPERVAHFGGAKPSLVERLSWETRLYLAVIQSAVYEFAEQDRAVILGRGGQWLLRGVTHALRLRVIAPYRLRVERMSAELTRYGQGAGLDAVREMVRRDDLDKAGRARYLYESDLDEPDLYDLVLNTETVGVDAAVDPIVKLVERPAMSATPESTQVVADRGLASRVGIALAASADTRRHRFEVEARTGAVCLTGTAGLEAAARIATLVPGVRAVESRSLEVPFVPLG
jgi:cytidylate kinase